MIRQILNITWGVAICIALVTFILAIGSTLESLTLEFSVTAAAAAIFVLIGAVVFEIESRSFTRGWDSHGEIYEKRKRPNFHNDTHA